ncbi:2-oxoglutarate-dependent ethylene/succinate-forming enzyme [Marinomonas aquimarina]|uniref:2-oxoglutarate-dependent ethylene/succinate-forming enzyme n=1 Tax=Marinomonas aquimarina TaxID=295068 RepID=A0A1A8T771_9GAMM|nr:2-oxoglutarate and iron-dependent oxygenase domain-containing protein [Marinomonas aquimarina]SBS27210.1 2-oxoglutarate-dependent ethylene/succinate-forming enzyme [Marinomonas aquimarina]
MGIPLIDYSKLTSPNNAVREKEIQFLDTACREIGFFYLINTDIDKALVKRIMKAAKRFFDTPLEDKLKIDIKNSMNHRGYGGVGEEQLDEVNKADWKETFDMALDLPADHPLAAKYPKMYGPNQNPSDPVVLETLHDYYVTAFSVAQNLLIAMAEALQLEKDFFTKCFKNHVTVLRMIHYPPRPNDDHDNGAGAHTDYGCVTLLLQDDIGGLEVKHRNGEWLQATPMEGSIVVNIGDLMQRWTNDEYVSTAHRVRASQTGVHRYSFPFFVEPDYETTVACVPTCQSAEKPAKYESIYSGDWIQSRFDATYAYREKESA